MNVILNRRRAIMTVKSDSIPLLPSEYQQVEWVGRSSSPSDNGCINTEFIPTPQSSMYARLAAIGSQSNANFLGSRDGTTGADNAFLVVSFSSARKIGFFRWGSSVQCIGYDTDFHDYELTPTTAKIDGISYTLAAPVASQSSTQPIYLFRAWDGRMYNVAHPIKLASCSLWDNGVKMRDYMPCYKKEDGTIGMYDLVTSSFKEITGYGSNPQKGPDVN